MDTDDDVRLTKRLYIPEKKFLRGFDVYKTGPKDGDDYIGGNYSSLSKKSSNFQSFTRILEIKQIL